MHTKYFRDNNLDFLKEINDILLSRIFNKRIFSVFACLNCKFPAVDYIGIMFNMCWIVLGSMETESVTL